MKNKYRQNLGWCVNDEKLKEHTIKLRQGLRGVPIMTNQITEWMTVKRSYKVVAKMRNQREKELTSIKPRWCPNNEKPKDHVPMISYKWKKGTTFDRTQKVVRMMKNK